MLPLLTRRTLGVIFDMDGVLVDSLKELDPRRTRALLGGGDS